MGTGRNGATAIAGGNQERLFPERVPDEPGLRGKGLPGEHRAGPGHITHQKTVPWNWILLLWS